MHLNLAVYIAFLMASRLYRWLSWRAQQVSLLVAGYSCHGWWPGSGLFSWGLRPWSITLLHAASPHPRTRVAVGHETQHCALHEHVCDQGPTKQPADTACSAHRHAAVKMHPFPVDGALFNMSGSLRNTPSRGTLDSVCPNSSAADQVAVNDHRNAPLNPHDYASSQCRRS